MKKRSTKVIAIIAIFCVAFTSLPLLSGTLNADAMAKKKKAKAAKNITLYASAYGQTGANLSWNKIKSPNKGYAVFRDGVPIAHYGKGTTAYYDRSLRAGTAHTYQIRTYTSKKKTQYYNKKTGRWQNKRPAKKYRGGSKKVVTYTYKKRSNAVSIRTAALYRYTIRYDANGGTGAPANGVKVQNQVYTVPTTVPTREGYTFTGWTIVETGYKNLQPGRQISANSNANYTLRAQWEETNSIEYTVTWKNWDGKVLGTSSVKAGVTPVYGGTPTRAADDNYTYTFSGWSPSVVAVNGNAVYTAQFKATEKSTTPSTEPTSQYSYDIKFINEPYGNGGYSMIYVKTNNPSAFGFVVTAEDQFGNVVMRSTGENPVRGYDDIKNVKDGYVVSSGPSKAGKITFIINECDTNGNEYKVFSKTVNVRDYAAEEEAWYQSVINEATDSSMTNKEKMQAICGYILGHYKYTKTDGNRYITLLADEGIPYWKGRLNSSSSPSILVNFGEYLGYPLENLYAKYPSNTPEWKQYHMYAYSAEDDWYFQACPATDTGLMSRSDIVPFDPETYEFWEE